MLFFQVTCSYSTAADTLTIFGGMGVHDEMCLGVLTYRHSSNNVRKTCTSKPSPSNLAQSFGFSYFDGAATSIKSTVAIAGEGLVGEPEKKPVRFSHREGRSSSCLHERCLYEDPYLSRYTTGTLLQGFNQTRRFYVYMHSK